MTHVMIQQAMGFYLAAGLSLTMLPGIVMGGKNVQAIQLRRVGQVIVCFSMVLLAALMAHAF